MTTTLEKDPSRTLSVGLTGGLASGKSTVARLLRDHGCLVVDADELVAQLYLPGEPGAEVIRRIVGTEVMTVEGGVDHERLAAKIFSSPTIRQEVESAIHPLVGERFRALVEHAEDPIVVFEAPLLVEAGMADDFDLVVTVEAPVSLRLQRAVARGMDDSDARARLEAQLGEGARRETADLVIDNGGTLEDLGAEVKRLLSHLHEAHTALSETDAAASPTDD